jgi:hypothetical protein
MVVLICCSCKNPKVVEPAFTLIETNVDKPGADLEITFNRGKTLNEPTFVFWIEDLEGNYIETLYITRYFGSGIYARIPLGGGRYKAGQSRAARRSALPHRLHQPAKKEGKVMIPSPDQPLPDGITSATPQGDFVIHAKALKPLPPRFKIMFEINQPWDFNKYWNNTLYPDFDYQASSQPALVYSATVDQSQKNTVFFLEPIGHSHYSGLDGRLFPDLSTLTTAKQMVQKVSVKFR